MCPRLWRRVDLQGVLQEEINQTYHHAYTRTDHQLSLHHRIEEDTDFDVGYADLLVIPSFVDRSDGSDTFSLRVGKGIQVSSGLPTSSDSRLILHQALVKVVLPDSLNSNKSEGVETALTHDWGGISQEVRCKSHKAYWLLRIDMRSDHCSDLLFGCLCTRSGGSTRLAAIGRSGRN
jgi:hypothetical protein